MTELNVQLVLGLDGPDGPMTLRLRPLGPSDLSDTEQAIRACSVLAENISKGISASLGTEHLMAAQEAEDDDFYFELQWDAEAEAGDKFAIFTGSRHAPCTKLDVLLEAVQALTCAQIELEHDT